MKYYDMHTHSLLPDAGTTAIVNRYWSGSTAGTGWYSAGLHPWYLDSGEMGDAAQWLEEQAASPHCVAIGEAGLDRVAGAPWDLQMAAFEICVACAITLQKPLILHCVRAFEDILVVKRRLGKSADQIPWIFHGFNKKPDIARRMLNTGAFLSFGGALLETPFPAAAALQICPADRFFLETDDRTDIAIQAIYAASANIRGISIEEMGQQLESNFKRIFL
jgi:TatD DNase family protein